ncbi:hypothetical protein CHELA20_11369 [Hyphomicrobiales bacterium]|nr:hypothetical protein CHELA20_11369 [Hyphomicrobiales bacterium]
MGTERRHGFRGCGARLAGDDVGGIAGRQLKQQEVDNQYSQNRRNRMPYSAAECSDKTSSGHHADYPELSTVRKRAAFTGHFCEFVAWMRLP